MNRQQKDEKKYINLKEKKEIKIKVKKENKTIK